MFGLPTPHGDKLKALLGNNKLPLKDRPRVEQAIERYQQWLGQLADATDTPEQTIRSMVFLLAEYKFYVDVELVFDDSEDFLYRQKGQLKLDNTVIEEFLPILVTSVFRDELENRGLSLGPTKSFAGVWFESGIREKLAGGGIRIRSKDQDFAISRPLFIRASHSPDFHDEVTHETSIAYVAAECKTNLDKTMFQEAVATARDIKTCVPTAKYYLICEWLDMTPINTALTPIDEVIILRKCKRISSNIRQHFSTPEGRKRYRESYVEHLRACPLSPDSFSRFLGHVRELVRSDHLAEHEVLNQGYF